MGRLLRFVKVIRNNWKKSTFAAGALSYCIISAKNNYDRKQLMREYCTIASKYGDVTHQTLKPFRHITVILNPAANKKKAQESFKLYCVPLLHLAGLAVTVVQTEFAGQAKDLLETLDPKTDAVVIAGGDGTVAETVTGLLRRADGNLKILQQLPVGILPLGRTNSISQALQGDKEDVRALADATMAVVDGILKPVDVIKVEPIVDEGNSKAIYSLAHVQWGSFRDAIAKQDKYWYFGGLRQYASYLFSKVQEGAWTCSYIEPCAGCSKCREKPIVNTRWWHYLVPFLKRNKEEIDYSKIINENCGNKEEKQFSVVEFSVESATVSRGDNLDAPHMELKVGPSSLSWLEFVSEGWKRVKGSKSEPVEKIAVRDLIIKPTNSVKGEEDWFSIDSEDFEVKPVKVTVLPRTIHVFQPRLNGYV